SFINLHSYYGKRSIVLDVSLSVFLCEFVGLLGCTCVGKSTTLNAVMDFAPPSQGQVLLAGRSITGLPAHTLARLGIAYVPEDRRIFRFLTVMENLRTGLDRHGVTAARKRELLDKDLHWFPVLTVRHGTTGRTLIGSE